MPNFKELIDQIKCELEGSNLFTDADLKALDLCLVNEIPVRPSDPLMYDLPSIEDPTACIQSIEKMSETSKQDLAKSIQLQIVKSKLQELYDVLSIVHEYKKTRFNKLQSFIKDKNSAPSGTTKVNLKAALSSYACNIISDNHSPIRVIETPSGTKFEVNIPMLKSYKYKDFTEHDVTLTITDLLKNKTLLENVGDTEIFAYEQKPAPKLGDKLYSSIRGNLYKNDSGYPGFYWKLEDPKNRLFTLAERGLTLQKSAMDPSLKNIGGSVSEDGKSYYISNIDLHEKFYETFQTELDRRIEIEKKTNLAQAISLSIQSLRIAATNEAVNSFNASNNLNSVIDRYRKEFRDIDDRLKSIIIEINSIKGVNSGENLKNGILKTKCFGQGQSNPCDDVKATLGSDPIGYKAMVGGPVSSNPDFTTMCYWKEFAKCATKLGLLPVPGDRMTNPRKLRYWPIGLVVPTPSKLIKIPMPHIWIPIALTSSPIGTIVVFIAQCGIVPSPFVFVISNTGSKNFIVSLKGPQKNMGYEVSANKPLFKTNVKAKPTELLKGMRTSIDLNGLTKMLSSSDSVDSYVDEFMLKTVKAIDKIGEIRLDAVSKVMNSIDKSTIDQKIGAIQTDLIKSVNKIKLGSIKFPKDSGKLKHRKTGLEEIVHDMNDLASRGESLTDKAQFKVKHVIDKFVKEISSIDINIKITGSNTQERVESAKSALKKFNSEIFMMAKGKKQPKFNIKSGSKPSKLKDIQESYNNRQDQYKRLMSTTVAKVLTGAKIELFNPFKNCCTAKPYTLPETIDPAVILLLSATEKSIESIITKLSENDLKTLILEPNIGLNAIKVFFRTAVMPKFPNISLPSSIDIGNLSTILKFIAPTLGKLSIPQIPFISVPGLPKQIDINLDSMIKPLLLETIKKTDFIKKMIPVDLDANYGTISSADLKGLLKRTVTSTQRNLKSKLQPIIKIADSVKSVKGASKTAIDAAFPILNVKSEANALLKSKASILDLAEVVDSTIINGLLKTAMPVLDKTMRLPGSHIPIVALAALEQQDKARKIHPIMNQDDLPSWDRLTLKNPLFVLFLDAFCSTAADCTAIILGRTWP